MVWALYKNYRILNLNVLLNTPNNIFIRRYVQHLWHLVLNDYNYIFLRRSIQHSWYLDTFLRTERKARSSWFKKPGRTTEREERHRPIILLEIPGRILIGNLQTQREEEVHLIQDIVGFVKGRVQLQSLHWCTIWCSKDCRTMRW